MTLFGIKLVGINAENGHKLLLTAGLLAGLLILRFVLVQVIRLFTRKNRNERLIFWLRQGSGLITAVLFLIGVVSIWFDDPARFATGAGLFSAGLAFALQKVVTSVAGYFVIMRGARPSASGTGS